ncbi:MAG: radical SAM protein [Phycisphaerales bacterium]|nr:MAG: radical SAM protein [Phycisphaerales bacterium]
MARKAQFIAEGIRHATINGHRFHLRLTDPTRDNFLWIDGQSPALVLDQVAAEFVGHLIDAMWEHQQGAGNESEHVREQVVERMYKRYHRALAFGKTRVSRERVRADLDRIFGTLMAIADGSCPLETGIEMTDVRQEQWAAPARMDLALTYRCNLDCPHCYAGAPRETGELTTADWGRVYEVLWRAGIPQIVFTGGEPTLRDDLVELVSQADEFVAGLVTNGIRLDTLAEPLRDASLDYVQVTLESGEAEVHNRLVGACDVDAFAQTVAGIRKALDLGMEVVTNTTLMSDNAAAFGDLLKFGKELGLANMACNSLICSGRGTATRRNDSLTLEDLNGILSNARRTAQELGLNLQWYTPTCYHRLNPVELGFGPKSCSAAAHNMTIEPDGSVLPCQSWPETVGRILEDRWADIWSHPICCKLRQRGFGEQNEECAACPELSICGGGCPLESERPRKDKP